MKQDLPRFEEFSRKILVWFGRRHRRLPWRRTQDAYKIWISEIMLQQTTVKAVIPYYEKWLDLFPDVRNLARAPLQKVLKTWQGLGYYQRARNLHRAVKIIAGRYNGRIPEDYDTLRGLPGFGPYTTAAVLSIAFNKPYPVLDANVRRVVMRLLAETQSPGVRPDKTLMRFLKKAIPGSHPGRFNQAMMELGALICKSQSPACLQCPVLDFCRAYKKGIQEIIPEPRKLVFQKIETVVAVIRNEKKYLIQQRPGKGLFAGLWEFPGGKIEPGESPEQALRREIREELGVSVSCFKILAVVHHAYTKFRVKLHAYECRLAACPAAARNRRWADIRALKRRPFHSGSAKIIRLLEKRENLP